MSATAEHRLRVVSCLRAHIVLADAAEQHYYADYPKDILCVCGDEVLCEDLPSQQGHPQVVITERKPRRNLLQKKRRGDAIHQIAANVGYMVIVSDMSTTPDTLLIDDCLTSCTLHDIVPVVLFSKKDIAGDDESIAAIINTYRRIGERAGFAVLETSAHRNEGIDALLATIHGETAILVGLSGAGKTSLANRILPDLDDRVAALSKGSGRGRHTTTRISWHQLPDQRSALIDSPGVHSYVAPAITVEAIRATYTEFYPFIDDCRFPNCTHDQEPGCAVRQAVEAGQIAVFRHQHYLRQMHAASEPTYR